MTAAPPEMAPAWRDALTAARVFAVDPVGTGLLLRARAGPVRARLLALLAHLLDGRPLRPVPLHAGEARLLGGLDLAASLAAGRPLAERGLLAEADGGVLQLAMAERLGGGVVAVLTAAMDLGESVLERDGFSLRRPARFGVIALDEGLDDERVPAALRDRLACHIDCDAVAFGQAALPPAQDLDVAAARARLPSVVLAQDHAEAVCRASLALGIVSLRAPLQALRVARAHAALAGRTVTSPADLSVAAALVLAPRATRLPAPEADEPPPADPPAEAEAPTPPEGDDDSATETPPLEDLVLAAAAAALPPEVLAALRGDLGVATAAGRAGASRLGDRRGRPVGTRRGAWRPGARLDLLATLRAAAPWQPLRRGPVTGDGPRPRLVVRKDDLRLTRFKARSETATLFVVDASGSAALHRLAEAKGAVELLLADCYVRRDQVALIGFRGAGADLLLPPTRSLTRAKRSLADLPGGGGTPVAAALDAARLLALGLARRGPQPLVVMLTDGRANIARDGTPGREVAEADALASAAQFRAAGCAAVVIDTAPRPGPQAARLAAAMGARYLALPHADAAMLSRAVRASRDGDAAAAPPAGSRRGAGG
jgi:magnesium chelatase subunit D